MEAFFLSALFDPHGDGEYYDTYDEDRRVRKKGLVCRRCGKADGLYWLPDHTGRGGFLMHDENGLHRCAMPANVDDFEDLTTIEDMI